MKKKLAVRIYAFSDAKLFVIANEKIAFMKRDGAKFAGYGITATMITELETKVSAFSNFSTDIESLSNQTTATAAKDAKAAALRTAITEVMTRAELKYGVKNPKYKKFGANVVSKQTDANLFITGKRVVRVGNILLTELATNGLTAAQLDNITTLCNEFETLLIDAGIKVGERDIEQEDRVEAGNSVYSELVRYTNTGQSIWGSSDVAKSNDYIIYNTVTGNPQGVSPLV